MNTFKMEESSVKNKPIKLLSGTLYKYIFVQKILLQIQVSAKASNTDKKNNAADENRSSLVHKQKHETESIL